MIQLAIINKILRNSPGVSIVNCTNKLQFVDNLFKNYSNQNWNNKELIIIVNRNAINLTPYRNRAKHMKNVSIYRLPADVSLGYCLNFAISKARYNYIAKFDDDDYYAPNYISRSMTVLMRENIDVVWKIPVYVYLQSKKCLYIRYPNRKDKLVGFVPGGTIMFKKRVFKFVKFSNVSLGEDARFLKKCRAMVLKLATTDKYNYVYIRRKNSNSHSMKVQDRYWIKRCDRVNCNMGYKSFVRR
jgi:glycosyltransferase involved in cell wall biosynthesis